MTVKEEYLGEKLEKAGMTLKGIAALITQSFEIEAMTTKDSSQIRRTLGNIGAGVATQFYLNDGNGWNGDSHRDYSLVEYASEHGGLYGTETSTSPIDVLGFASMKAEIARLLDIYTQAAGTVRHTVKGSTHVHNTISYMSGTNSVRLDVEKVYNNAARFLIKFLPVMKWLTMTDKRGARGVRGSSYGDQFEHDKIYEWWNNYGAHSESISSFNYLTSMARASCFRTYSRESVHFENRLCDATYSPTHLAMWLSINKALVLFAVDFTRNGYMFPLTDAEVRESQSAMRSFRRGYENVDRGNLDTLYKSFVSYLAKYLRVINSLDAIEIMDKLMVRSIPEWLNENNYPEDYWKTEDIEKAFNMRNRAVDDGLRIKYLHAIKSMQVPHAENLNDFHDNVSAALGVEVKKVKSLYQMFKRENVDIEFLGGRLVYMGD